MKRIATLCAAAVVTVIAPSAIAQDMAPPLEGWYLRGSGMYLRQYDGDVRGSGLTNTDMEFDSGWGATVGVGYRFPDSPFSLELEGSYRTADFDTIDSPIGEFSASGDIWTGALMFNGMADIEFPDSPFGLYIGAGIGAAYTEAELDAIGGLALSGADEDDITFAWQAMGGVTWRLGDSAQLYGGVRWFDAEDPDFDDVRIENRNLSFELGIKVYF